MGFKVYQTNKYETKYSQQQSVCQTLITYQESAQIILSCRSKEKQIRKHPLLNKLFIHVSLLITVAFTRILYGSIEIQNCILCTIACLIFCCQRDYFYSYFHFPSIFTLVLAGYSSTYRDVTTGKIQVRPCKWWAESAPPPWLEQG